MACRLNALRKRWLNPPEWTQTRTLTLPGSADGPWARYLDPATVDPATDICTVRYPRLEPRDADTAAYGWAADLSDGAILECLLALNLARAAEERAAQSKPRPRASRSKANDELL